jgi:radical SAM protein with 4Fe4S-binding SPASM domain
MIDRIAGSGVKAVSISLDGANPATHDGVRGIPGHFDATMQCIRAFADTGLTVQVNTTVMRANVDELADVAACVAQSRAHIWEVFFLVQMGRGEAVTALTPEEHEDVCHFLYDASHYGFVVRTVEAPFFRRVVALRNIGMPASEHTLYRELLLRLTQQLGDASGRKRVHTAATRDGKGVLFVAYDGDVYPAGFLPVPLGNMRDQPLVEIYRDNPLLRSIRAARFTGRCGRCEYADLCGGSRARAYAASGDPLGEDPACPYQPAPQPGRPSAEVPVR